MQIGVFLKQYFLFKPSNNASANSIDRKCVHHICDVIFSTLSLAYTIGKLTCTSIKIKACGQSNTYWGISC